MAVFQKRILSDGWSRTDQRWAYYPCAGWGFWPFPVLYFLNNPEYYRASPCCWPRSWVKLPLSTSLSMLDVLSSSDSSFWGSLHALQFLYFPLIGQVFYFRMEIGNFFALGGGARWHQIFLGLILSISSFRRFSFFSTRNFLETATLSENGVMTKNDRVWWFHSSVWGPWWKWVLSTPVPKHWCSFWENGLDFAVLLCCRAPVRNYPDGWIVILLHHQVGKLDDLICGPKSV